MASEYTPNRTYPLYTDQDKPNLRDQYNGAIRKIDTDMKQALNDSSGVVEMLGAGFDQQHTVRMAIDSANTAITNEATARQNADTALSGSIADEVNARQNADTTLSTSITQEATARQNADTALGNRITDEATARQNADRALSGSIDAISTEISTIKKYIVFASFLGFSPETSDAQANTTLYNQLDDVVIYCDIDIPFSSPISFTKSKYITGPNKLIYTGSTSSNFFVTMEPTPNSEIYALYGASIDCAIECNNNINGFSWHGGIATTVSLCALNPNLTGIQIEHNDTTNVKPSYGNTYSLFTHKNVHQLGTTGINIYAADDTYERVETGNYEHAINVYRNNNTIKFAHPWVASDTIYPNSVGISVLSSAGSLSIGTIFCDVVRYGIVMSASCAVHVDYMYNFWESGFATNYTGADVPFVINNACRLVIDTLYWHYKSGSLDQTTGLSNTRIKILENHRYVSISKLLGLVFVGDLSNSPECSFMLPPTNTYSEKYTNVPTGFNPAADSYSIEIVRAANEIPDSFEITNTKYKLMANRDSQWFIAQSNAGANISWYSVNMQSVS